MWFSYNYHYYHVIASFFELVVNMSNRRPNTCMGQAAPKSQQIRHFVKFIVHMFAIVPAFGVATRGL
jgi:hypothetical protein